jgi:hypothetical protein
MRMGLLDDAIREHLELKRRRGADPGEVAREQREVLDSPAETDAVPADIDADPGAAADADPLDAATVDADAQSPHSDPPARTAVEGETAELDMSSVLGEEEATGQSAAPVEIIGDLRADPGASAPSGTAGDEDSLEWVVPGETVEDEPDEPAEDVLEETPDFLRDTPEQERLWFEQRPPRDFDFDK